MNRNDWLNPVVAATHRPGAELRVRFENLDGYEWTVTPLERDELSWDIARLTRELLRVMVEEVVDPLEAVALLDRLYVGSPVRVRPRPGMGSTPLKDIRAEMCFMFWHVVRASPEARLLSIRQPSCTMDFTLRDPFDPASAVELWPHSTKRRPCVPRCPVCDGSSGDIQAAYPGTEGCLRCGTIFVDRSRGETW